MPQDPKLQRSRSCPTFVILELLARAPTVEKLFADGAYAAPKLAGRLKKLGLSGLLEIETKPEGKTRRVCFWTSRSERRRESALRTLASSLAWVKLAVCRFLMRRVAKSLSSGKYLQILSI